MSLSDVIDSRVTLSFFCFLIVNFLDIFLESDLVDFDSFDSPGVLILIVECASSIGLEMERRDCCMLCRDWLKCLEKRVSVWVADRYM